MDTVWVLFFFLSFLPLLFFLITNNHAIFVYYYYFLAFLLLGPECPHGFGYTVSLPATANRIAGAMSNAMKDLIEALPNTNWF